jgi:hypothetical protein
VFRGDFIEVEKSLVRLLERGVDVIAILLDAGSFVKDRVHGKVKMAVETQVDKARIVLEGSAARLTGAGILTYVIKSGADIGREMLNPTGNRGVRQRPSGESAGS